MDAAFGTIWEAVNDRLPDVPAVTEPDRSFTRREWDERSSRLAAALADAGVRAGDTVACYLYNGAAYLETVFAAFKLGAIPVNANYRYTGGELASLLADAGAAALVHSPSLAENVLVAAEQVPTLRLVAQAGDEPYTPVPGGRLYEELLAEYAPLPHAPRPGSDRLFMYTGGTTGRPKGVIWQHADLLHSIAVATYTPLERQMPQSLDEAVQVAVDVHEQGRTPITMPIVPLMHGTGLFNTIGTLLVGGQVVFAHPGRLNPLDVWQTLALRRADTIIVAGNAVARPLVDELLRAETVGMPHDLSSLRVILSSGTSFSDELKLELHRRAQVQIIDTLASSEGGPFAFAITSSTDDLPSRFMPVPATALFTADDERVEPGDGRAGLLSYCGPLPVGYHNDETKSAQTFRVIEGKRWSQPGDLAELTAEGAIRFLGRGSSVINTGGEKVHTQEVEDALLSHPAVRDVVVVGVDDPLWGQRVAAVVAVGPDEGVVSADELVEHVRQELAGYKVPRLVRIVPELPRTPTGKIEVAWAKQAAAEAAQA
jgi:acyl-CoA synthetase (AMP-forming)/AMP-acid ligase II